MDIDLRQLVHLLAIARHGTFSRAAAEQRLSQPALSSSIRQLESRIGGAVLTRGRHGARLTDLGRMVIRHAEHLEVQMDRLSEEIRHHRGSARGPLVIAVTPVAAAELVPRALGRLRREIPNVSVSVVETVFNDAMPALIKGEFDLMVGPVGVYPRAEGVEEERLATDPFSVIVRAGHSLARRRSTSLRQLEHAEWVLPSDQSAYHRQLEALFVVAGLRWPTVAVVTNSMVAMKSIVAHSDGVAIMPRQLVALERRAGLLHGIALAEAGGTRALGLSWAKDRQLSPLAQRFAEITRECAQVAG